MLKERTIFFSWGFHIFDKWIQIKNEGESLQRFFEDNAIYCIAIYGMGAIGKRLYEELRYSSVEIKYGIDQNAENIQIDGLCIKTLEDILPPIDAVIITPMDFYEIEKNVYHKMGRDIDTIFIEDVVDYCFALL